VDGYLLTSVKTLLVETGIKHGQQDNLDLVVFMKATMFLVLVVVLQLFVLVDAAAEILDGQEQFVSQLDTFDKY
jgi:hypothetical protein